MDILLMQPLPRPATDWLRAQGAQLHLAYEDDTWRAQPGAVKALIYYSVPIDKPLLDALPALEVIGKRGAGIDLIDLDEASRRGIKITNVGAGGNSGTVAEHALTLLMAATRSIPGRDAAVRQGRFHKRFEMPLVQEVTGTRLGLVGIGHIGRRVAAIFRHGLGCEIGFYDPYVDDAVAAETGARRFDTVADLFGWADNAAIAAPLTGQTRGMIGLDELRLLGPDAVVVIVSRGGIVAEDALVTALRSGLIRGAGVDVYDGEPPRDDHPLFGAHNAVLTPHVAGASVKSRERTSMVVCQQVWALLHGEDAPVIGAQPWLELGTT